VSNVIENLERLNRKERFFLVGMALGNPQFRLETEFRKELDSQFHLTIPEDAFVAMDYHLNWIYAACALTLEQPVQNRIYKNVDRVIDSTQEDVDLLVSYQDPSGMCHLIMLEAKGVTAFSNRQFKHKIERFKQIFRDDGKRWPRVTPHFGLVSPNQSKALDYDICPSWLKVNGKVPWFKMNIPKNRLVLFGCDGQGMPDQERPFWTVKGSLAGLMYG